MELNTGSLQIYLMQQDMEEIMKNIKINRADLKSITILITLSIMRIIDDFAIVVPPVLREQDRAFEEEKFAD